MTQHEFYQELAKPGDLVSWEDLNPMGYGDEDAVIKIHLKNGEVTKLTVYGVYLNSYESWALVWNGHKEIPVLWTAVKSLVPRSTHDETEQAMIRVLGVPSYMKGQF